MSRNDTSLQPLSSNAVSAKELARCLGLVKKRPSSSTSRSKGQEKEKKPSNKSRPIYLEKKHIIILHTEFIIEFPAVLLNTSTGEMESEFHMFVQPSEHTRLSEFCTELTGITQTQVDEGVPVGTCLMLFGRWLQEMREKKGFKFPCDQILNKDENKPTENLTKWCTFVTWSDWDLGTCLKNECYRKQLRVPHPLRSWIDLRATYKNFYSRKPQGLAGALQDLGIQFAGREHSGLDDARNTARLAWRMVSDGCIMQITKSTDGAVEKLWNVVTVKPGLSQNNLKANGTGAFHTSNQSDLMSEDMHVLHNKYHARPSKNCTDETSVNKSLNFGDFQAQNQCRNGTRQEATVKSEIKEPRSVQIPGNRLTNHHIKPSKSCTEETSVNESLSFGKTQEECHDVHVHGTRQSITVKRELAGARADQFPENKMTNLREKTLVWGAVKSGNNSEANGQNKRRASLSSVSEGISVVNCDGVCAAPKNTPKSLITPATCLSSLNKRARGCCDGLFKSELQSCPTQGFLVKRGLAKQTLSYHQHTPLGSHNQRVFAGTGQKDYTSCNQPCKASNIEPQNVNTPLFRLPTNHSLIEERHLVEGLKNNRTITVASNNIGITAINKPMAKAATVVTTPSSIYLNKPCTTPIRKFPSLNPPLNGNMNSPVTTPVACFNGGGITPPLCHCGRRTRRRAVINPGPNQGRAFFTCSFSRGRTTSGANADKKKSKSGCKFFRWEVRL